MKKAGKIGMGILKTGVTLGAGAQILGGIGGTPATNAATGLGNMSGALPAVGSIGGASMAIGAAKRLQNFYKVGRRKK